MTIEDFRSQLLTREPDDILNDILLTDGAKHCSIENYMFIAKQIVNKYRIKIDELKVIIVGSAKLGFSISEKRLKNGESLLRYRPFRPDSDIDVAIISPKIYELIWTELSVYSFKQPSQPWNSGKLGDYMVCGWLRPDHFPVSANLRKCNDWWEVFRFLSSQNRLGRRKIRGAVFYNFEQLKSYQAKALIDCIEYEKLKI